MIPNYPTESNYSYLTYIPSDPYDWESRSVTLYTCGTCHATVEQYDKRQHTDWHEMTRTELP